MPDDPRQLLLATHRGDQHAAVSLYRAFAPRMLAFARALTRHDAAAEDAVQQTFVRILTLNPDDLAGVQDVMAWLIQLTRNAALNAARTQTRSSLREKMRAGHERLNGTCAPAHATDSAEVLLAAIQTLPDECRELLLLKHVAGLTFDQIALSLGDNRHTLASRYRAALDQLRSTLALGTPVLRPTASPAAEVHHE